MKLQFERLTEKHRNDVMKILNYYVENSYAAYPEINLSLDFYNRILEKTKNYPAYVILSENVTIGFCYLSPYIEYATFNSCAAITYFIDKNYVGKGVGKQSLKKLETEAKQKGIKILLASITSENTVSLNFHLKNGFKMCGKFEKIIEKKGKKFDIIWMQKELYN